MSDRTLPGIQPSKPSEKRLWPWWVAITAGAVLLTVIFISSLGGGSKDYDSDTSYEATAQCEAAVEERLKSPSTANFDSTATGKGTWTVTGTVDAENSFGAMVRSEYQCSVIIDNVKDTARVRIDRFE